MARLEGVQTEWVLFEKAVNDGLTSSEFSQFLSEIVRRLNFNTIKVIDQTPNGYIDGDISSQAFDTSTNTTYIKTTDGGNTGWIVL